MAWSADSHLASVSRDGVVRVWEVASNASRVIGEHSGGVNRVFWSEGRLITVLRDNTSHVWDKYSGGYYEDEPIDSLNMPYSFDDRFMASRRDSVATVWDLEFGGSNILEGHVDLINDVVWVKGNFLATASDDNTVRIWNVMSGEHINERHHLYTIDFICWNNNNQLVSYSEEDKCVFVWNADSGASRLLEGHEDGVHHVAWSADGQLASASHDSTVRVWDPATGNACTLEGHTSSVRQVAWSADGRLASASDDGTVRVWDPVTGETLERYEGSSLRAAGLGDRFPETFGGPTPSALPFRAEGSGAGTIVVAQATGAVIAALPESLDLVRSPHDERVWAAKDGTRVYLFRLEDA